MRCSLCTHPKRSAIEAAAKATSVADAAEKFGVSESALGRHVSSHPHAPTTKAARPAPRNVRPQRVRATSPVPARERDDDSDDEESPATSRSPQVPTTARANARRIATTIDKLLIAANKDKSATYQDVSSLTRTALSANRQLAHLTGEWSASDSTVASSPHFKRLLNVILEALRGDVFGEARRSVIEALEREERGANPVAA